MEVRTWLELDQSAIAGNYQLLKGRLKPTCLVMGVVKSNAYGHGLVDFSQQLSQLGVNWLGVDSITEGLALRRAGITEPILILGYTLPNLLAQACQENCSVTISSWDNLRAWAALPVDQRPAVHLKLDTGMTRQGFMEQEWSRVFEFWQQQAGNNSLEGLYTHLAAAKNPSFPQFTQQQLDAFARACQLASQFGQTPLRHAAATAGALVFPESQLDMVRYGIGLYGLWPAAAVRQFLQEQLLLRPVLSWRSLIAEVKAVPQGASVGYDGVEKMWRDSRLAIVPIGYWQGFDRGLSSIGHVLVQGRRARVVGRVSMDMITVDITDIPEAQVGQVVTLLGRDGQQEITADEIASLVDTSCYEIVTRLNPLMKKLIN
ncbi:alanine racemase [Candidatus Falkowbacteria bacterium]|nr:alanine racemase [Candidatus Falkowbacteria bacterium]